LALPNFGRMIDSFSTNTTWRAIEAELGDLPYRAFSQGRAIRVESSNVRRVLAALPEDWQFVAAKAIVYRENGWCEGGTVSISTADGAKREYQLIAPKCEAVYQ
jgi:hypothetical protein